MIPTNICVIELTCVCVCVYTWMHLAKSEIRMKYKEGGLAGGAVVLDDLFRVRVRVCLFFCFYLNAFCLNANRMPCGVRCYHACMHLCTRVCLCMYVCMCVFGRWVLIVSYVWLVGRKLTFVAASVNAIVTNNFTHVHNIFFYLSICLSGYVHMAQTKYLEAIKQVRRP